MPAPLDILSVATTHPRWPGDSEPAFVHDLNRHLAERGHRVTCVVPHAPGARVEERMDGVTVRRFRYAPERFERLFYDGGALPNLRASWNARLALPGAVVALRHAVRTNLDRFRPDVLHVHWLVPQGYLAVGPAAARGIPLLLTAHGADVHATTRWPLRRLVAAAARRANAITANTPDTATRIERLAGSCRCHVVPMGLDLAVFGASPPNGERKHGTRLLAVGRLVEKKGFRYLIDAMPAIRNAIPDVRLAIAGDGPLRGALEKRCRTAGLDDIVRFLGPLDRAAVAQAMTSSDLFVGPSVVDASGDTEGQGVVFIEAMACGLPVVATTVGGIPDVVEHRVTGVLVAPRDATALADAVTDLLRDPDGRQRMGERGRLTAEHYAWPAIARRFEAVILELVR